jgi:hypothetical protein
LSRLAESGPLIEMASAADYRVRMRRIREEATA